MSAEATTSDTPFGDGEMPRELKRLNWAAFFFPTLWSLFYGAWLWFFLLFAIWLSRVGLSPRLTVFSLVLPDAVTYSIALVIEFALGAAVALTANRIVWNHARDRLSGRPRPAAARPEGYPTSAYLQGQRTIALIGLALMLVRHVLGVVQSASDSAQLKAVLVSYAVWFALLGALFAYDWVFLRTADASS